MFLCSQTNFWRWDGVHEDVPRDRVRSRSFRDDVDAHEDVPHDRVHIAAFVMMLMLMRVFLMIVLAAAAFVCESRSVMFGNSAFSFCNDNIRFQTVCDFLISGSNVSGFSAVSRSCRVEKVMETSCTPGREAILRSILEAQLAQSRFSII